MTHLSFPALVPKEAHFEVESVSADSASWCETCIVNEEKIVLANGIWRIFFIEAEAHLY